MKKISSILLLASMVISMSMVTMAAENPKNNNTPYSFPITPESSEWETFTTKQEMLDVCQIPEDKLSDMTTEALLETVIDYPLINDFMAFNSYENACNVMCSDFNGFRELLSRDDLTSVLLAKYSAVHVVSSEEANSTNPSDFFMPATIEYLLICDEIKNGEIIGEEAETLTEIHNEKAVAREKAGIYSMQSEVYSTYKKDEKAVKAAGDIWTAVAAGTVKTPKGSNVPEVYKRSPELTNLEKSSMNSDTANRYPRATRIAEPTVKYNCHSYAWYNRSIFNPYWIGKFSAPSIYTTDGSYYKYSGTPRSGMKAWYNNGEHSGISIGAKLEGGVQVHYVESKWGPYGVYQHPYSYSPYTPSVAWYTAN